MVEKLVFKNVGPKNFRSKILYIKFCENPVSNSWDISDMEKCCQFESVQEGPRDLLLKFDRNRLSNSWDIVDFEFSVVGGGWCAKSFSRKTQTDVMLGWVEVGLGFWQIDHSEAYHPLLSNMNCFHLIYFGAMLQ